jgi:hypothetical protein
MRGAVLGEHVRIVAGEWAGYSGRVMCKLRPHLNGFAVSVLVDQFRSSEVVRWFDLDVLERTSEPLRDRS